jgi:hypothetical protein
VIAVIIAIMVPEMKVPRRNPGVVLVPLGCSRHLGISRIHLADPPSAYSKGAFEPAKITCGG